MIIKKGSKVKHNVFGEGIVKYVDEETAGVRFEKSLEEVPLSELEYILSLEDCVDRNYISDSFEMVLKILANTIISINDTWGVFSLSRIELLPHQLWVCKRVLERKPFRWLVADDVGLGKTIEAGLILWPLLSRKIVNRLLILCPASLVMQWQERLRKMFDIALFPYRSELDTVRSDFWNTYDKVIASFHTLRLDNKNRHDRLLKSKKWDLLIVDEAHHLNAVEHQGETQGYKLIDKLQKNELIDSMIFFTGTPHRGKDFGFISLLHLLRPDLFNPNKDISDQIGFIKQVMIRNNKENVTDLKGKKLFKKPKVRFVYYSYTEEEEKFYNMMTDFILSGKAYANSLNNTSAKNAVMLVLISLQKIASSSVAAIRKALKNRLTVVQTELKKKKENRQNLNKLQTNYDEETSDAKRDIEEDKVTQLVIELMKDEEEKIKELLEYSLKIQSETRINKIIDLIKAQYKTESIILFTEYKATQSLLMSELIKNFGEKEVVFINGDNKARNVIINGERKELGLNRELAADLFNHKKARFLVSTEAAGEGIDLQKNCHTLIHVDIPWNPMRMQQRVGRINRYGQKKQVEVITLLNPDTVESKIWTTLNEKIDRIMKIHSSAMEDPEDFKWLILGMQDESFYNNLQMEARKIPKEKFTDWFDAKTKTFSGKEVINTVKNLVGHSDKFNFNKISKTLPRFDLPDLKYFFNAMLEKNKRRVIKQDKYFEFLTPEKWLNRPGMKKRYKNVIFSRKGSTDDNIIGVGNRLFEQALNQALSFEGLVTFVNSKNLKNNLFIVKIFDKVTTSQNQINFKIVGIESVRKKNTFKILDDNELFKRLNKLIINKIANPQNENVIDDSIIRLSENAISFLTSNFKTLQIPFTFPDFVLVGVLLRAD